MKIFYKIILLLTLSACVDVTSGNLQPAPNFRQYQPIYMRVSGIQVIEEYQSSLRSPNAEHLMIYSPADAMQIWVKQRLKAGGGSNTMQVVIKDASVIAKQLPTDSGLIGLIKSEVDREYNARMEVEMRIYGSDSALSKASINVVATRKVTMSENDSVVERDANFRAMLDDMMNSLNAELEKNIFQHLGTYVDYSRNP